MYPSSHSLLQDQLKTYIFLAKNYKITEKDILQDDYRNSCKRKSRNIHIEMLLWMRLYKGG